MSFACLINSFFFWLHFPFTHTNTNHISGRILLSLYVFYANNNNLLLYVHFIKFYSCILGSSFTAVIIVIIVIFVVIVIS